MKKMKNILTTIFAAVALLCATSCAKEEGLLFDKSAAERLNEASSIYSQRLLDSPHGWALEYFPNTETDEDIPIKGAGFLMLTKFDSDKSVVVAMDNIVTGNAYREDRSAWEVITDNGPVLSFNSHNNVLHTFSVPEDISGTSDDEKGKGFEGDYEFVMVDVPEGGDYIMLKGKKRGTYSRLTRLEEETDFSEYLADVKTKSNKLFNAKAPNHNFLTVGKNKYKMIMAQSGGDYGVAKIWPHDTDSTFTKELHPLIVTRHGVKGAYTYNVRFRNAFSDGEEVSEQEFVFDDNAQKFYGVNNHECVIEGPNPNDFMAERLEAYASLSLTTATEASADISGALEKIKSDFNGYKYTFQSIRFKKSDDGFRAAVMYRNNKKQNVTTYYNYSWKQNTDGSISFAYVSPVNESGETLLKSVPSIAEFFRTFDGQYNVTSYDSPLNLATVKFVAGEKYFANTPSY